MTDISYSQQMNPGKPAVTLANLRLPLTLLLALLAAALVIGLGVTFRGLADDALLFSESTPARLAVWMAGQSAEDAPESFLGGYAKNWAQQIGTDSLDPVILFNAMRNGVALWCWLVAALIAAGMVGVITR